MPSRMVVGSAGMKLDEIGPGICGVSETGATFTSTFSLGLDETLPEHGESEILCDDEVGCDYSVTHAESSLLRSDLKYGWNKRRLL